MAIRSAFAMPVLVSLAAGMAPCQQAESFLGRLDQFSRSFTGAKATIRSTVHTRGIPDDDVETGAIFVKRSGGKTQFRIDFTQLNPYSANRRSRLTIFENPMRQLMDLASENRRKRV